MNVVTQAKARLANGQRKQAGLSLIESLLVLAVISLILIGAYQGYKIATGDVKAGDNVKATTQLAGATSRLFSQSGNYAALTNQVMIEAQLIPNNIRVDGLNLRNSWGGDVIVGPGPLATAGTVPAPLNTNTYFKVAFSGVEAGDCTNFASGIAGTAVAVFVGPAAGTVVAVKPLGGALNPVTLATQCSGVGTKFVTAVFN